MNRMPDSPEIPEPAAAPPSRLSAVWILPVLCVVLGVWLIRDHLRNAGVPIRIHFATAKGVQIEKTQIRYRGIAIGSVTGLQLDDAGGVAVAAAIRPRYIHLATEGSQFWVVGPRVSLEEVADVDTWITGQYIAMRPGSGAGAREFQGLPGPPPTDPDAPGRHLVLRGPDPGSLVVGAPVLYHNIQAGRIEKFTVHAESGHVESHVYIEPAFAELLHPNTRFWCTNGMALSIDLREIRVDTKPLSALIRGGIAFATPGPPAAGAVADGAEFRLYRSQRAADNGATMIDVQFASAQGLVPGRTQVKSRGVVIGQLDDITLGAAGESVTARLALQSHAAQVAVAGSRFWVVRPRISIAEIEALDTLVSGPYIEADPGAGEPTSRFRGLDAPPGPADGDGGLRLQLRAQRAYQSGSPVLYRKVEIGRVAASRLADDAVAVDIDIYPGHESLIRESTRFYDVSGLRAHLDLSGLEIDMSGLDTVFFGGIGVTTDGDGAVATADSRFDLFASEAVATERGTVLSLQLPDARGIVPGRTRLRHQGMAVGRVQRLRYDRTEDAVIAEALLDENAAALARSNSRFFIVRPTVDLAGIANLDAALTGAYIGIAPGDGEAVRSFLVADRVPVDSGAGLRIAVIGDALGSLREGAPVLYHQIVVGQIADYQLTRDEQQVRISLFIQPQYAKLVRQTTVFWEASGIELEAGLDGLSVRAESVASLLAGGIAFDTPAAERKAAPAAEGREFELYASADEALATGVSVTVRFRDATGIVAGRTQVKYQGVTIGEVTAVAIEEDAAFVAVTARLETTAARLATAGAVFWLVRPQVALDGVSGLDTLIAGPYIALARGPGKPVRTFVAAAGPPAADPGAPGMEVWLAGKTKGALEVGSPLLFRRVEVGAVVDFEVRPHGVGVKVRVNPDYVSFVAPNSLFWHASGVEVKAGLSGVSMRAEGLAALAKGAVAFATPPGDGRAVRNGQRFQLHRSWAEAAGETAAFLVHLTTDRVGGIEDGAPVYYREVKIGRVNGHALSDDSRRVRITLGINPRFAPLICEGSRFWRAGGVSFKAGLFSGAEFSAAPLKSLLEGGVSFATPEGGSKGEPVAAGAAFELHDKAEAKWLQWAPAIDLKKQKPAE
jgi:paraquat-inducible protein B